MSTDPLPPAYSYLRYSSPGQGDGDSVRRQTTLASAWCKRNGRTLDTSTCFEDRGTSAFRGKHRKAGSPLSQFMADVETGRILKGSVLIIENLDRLSRENPWDAVPLLCGLVNAGIDVVTLSPSEMTYKRGRDLTPLVLACVEFGRAHSESASKSDRMGQVWTEKKRQAREDGAVVTRRLPAWVREKDGKLIPIPDRVAVVKRIFSLAVGGHGLGLIVKRLTEDKVAPLGGSGKWNKSYVWKILKGRAVLGEYQPDRDGKPDGPPLPDYYPCVIEEGVWLQAQAALARRKDKPGRVGEKVASVFAGLLWDAVTRGRMLIAQEVQGKKGQREKRRILRNADSMEGRAPLRSFPYAVFEAGVLSLLREVTPADVMDEESEGDAAKLAAERAALEVRIAQIEAELTDDADADVPSLTRVLKALDTKRVAVAKFEAEARQKESCPAGVAWAEARTLLDAAREETHRLRLRSLLQQVVSEVWVLVVPRRSYRLAAVQIHFVSGARRDYLLTYQSAGRGRPGGWWATSLASVPEGDDLDLREEEDVRALERKLLALDILSIMKGE